MGKTNIIGGTLESGEKFYYVRLHDLSIVEATAKSVYTSVRTGKWYVSHLDDQGQMKTVNAERAYKNSKVANMELRLSRDFDGGQLH
jgi:hypothetical protein